MRASTSPLGAELARWAARSHPGYRRIPSQAPAAVRATRICSPQMRVVWVSGVCVPGAGLHHACAAQPLPPLSDARAASAAAWGRQGTISNMQKRTNEEGIDRTRARSDVDTHDTHTDTDRHTHTRTDATRPFRGIQSRIHQFRQCCTACKRGQLAQAEAAWHGAHFLYQAVSSPAVLL